LAVSWLLVPASSFAQEVQWRPSAAAEPAGGSALVGLSRPVPLTDAAAAQADAAPTVPHMVVRGQSGDDPKPLPSGPTLVPDPTASPLSPFLVGKDNKEKEPDKTKETDKSKNGVPAFVAPQPQTGLPPVVPQMPPANGSPPTTIWGGPAAHDRLLGITGESGLHAPAAPCSPCSPCPPCPTTCCPTCSSVWGTFCGWASTCCGGLFSHGCCSSHDWASCCNPCGDSCCNRPTLWVSADYLLWSPQHQSVPPLVTVSALGSFNGNLVAPPLGSLGTAAVFSGFEDLVRSGWRVSGGMWFSPGCCWGLDASYWQLASSSRTFTLAGDGNPLIARPFNSATGPYVGPDRELVAFPNLVTGSVSVNQTQQMWGLEANFRRNLFCGCNGSLDLVFGYRRFNLSEGLFITENLSVLNTPEIVSDRFHASNTFDAPQIGVAGEWRLAHSWSLAASTRVAFGVNHEVVDIGGNTIFFVPQPVVGLGGLLALPSNIGSRSASRFAVMPEVNLKIGYDITPSLRVYAGYDFLYITSAVRPGNQIDLNINKAQLPIPVGNVAINPSVQPPPQALFNAQSFWVQGFSVGLMYRY
jgi:hypothetical protein